MTERPTAQKKDEWAQEQLKFRDQLVKEDIFTWQVGDETLGNGATTKPLQYVGGVDISFVKESEIDACAAFFVLSFPEMKCVYQKMEMIQLTEPYIPSYLAFRECPPLVPLVQSALADPECPGVDVILVDGNGGLYFIALHSISI